MGLQCRLYTSCRKNLNIKMYQKTVSKVLQVINPSHLKISQWNLEEVIKHKIYNIKARQIGHSRDSWVENILLDFFPTRKMERYQIGKDERIL